ncbi:MAG: ribose transport system substrate-binding protein [Halanaerobiales bacterium]|nr:ribose transport system substrate-binding protein [Halanaerobiales bacterium]
MKKLVTLLLVTVLVFSMASMAFAEETKYPEKYKGIKVGITFMTTNNPFFVAMLDAVKEEVEGKLGGTVIVSDGQFNVAKQIADVEDMIVQGIDLLLFNAVDSDAAEPAVVMAKEAGIPVVCLDVDAAGPRDMFIGSDNYQAGVLDAEYTVKRLNGKGKVVIINGTPVTSVRNRYKGFMDTIKNYPGIEIVAEQNGETNLTKSLEVTENVLQSQPEIDAIFGINDPTALGALAAVQAAGREDELFITGVDGSPDGVQAILDGTAMAATAAQDPAKIGRLGVEYGIKILEGEEVPDYLPVPVKLITIENAEGFHW